MSPAISDAEWEVMKVLWAGSPRTANQIVAELDGRVSWTPKTVRTLISRLLSKGALRFEPRGREYLYTPTLSESDCVHEQARSFLDRVFGGSVAPMVAHLADRGGLTDGDLAELRRLLDEQAERPRATGQPKPTEKRRRGRR